MTSLYRTCLLAEPRAHRDARQLAPQSPTMLPRFQVLVAPSIQREGFTWAYVFLMISTCASHVLGLSLTVHLGTFLLVWSFASNPCIRGRNRPEGFSHAEAGTGVPSL